MNRIGWLTKVQVLLQFRLQPLRHEHSAWMPSFGLFCTQSYFCFDPSIWVHDIGNGETGYFPHTHACVKAKCQDQSVAHGVGALGYKFQQVFKFCWG
jgi:hypothetical protein